MLGKNPSPHGNIYCSKLLKMNHPTNLTAAWAKMAEHGLVTPASSVKPPLIPGSAWGVYSMVIHVLQTGMSVLSVCCAFTRNWFTHSKWTVLYKLRGKFQWTLNLNVNMHTHCFSSTHAHVFHYFIICCLLKSFSCFQINWRIICWRQICIAVHPKQCWFPKY